ncbi:hypothetical protein NC653_007796 [Populus alba x Populus x berolinensis]|uniref:Uncharacterized protein n=1 Tax=Populus alba x Populus x berolinensis TaxID=444605 RepID=A0AAD6R571_9ROSI|nr:hypothetical protein NC653_007796 [Populus alba x Populus x berolinensis]
MGFDVIGEKDSPVIGINAFTIQEKSLHFLEECLKQNVINQVALPHRHKVLACGSDKQHQEQGAMKLE